MEFEFEKNGVVESLDTVPEKYRGLYGEGTDDNKGKFVLTDVAKPLVADYVGMAKSAAGLRQEKKSVTDESASRRVALTGINDAITALGVEIGEEGVVPAIEAYVAGLQEKVKGGAQMKVDLGALKAQFDKQLVDGLAAKDTELESMMLSLRKYMVTGAASVALVKHKGAPELLLPHVMGQADMVKDDSGEYVVRIKDPEGSYRINGSGAFMGVDDLVAEMKTKEAFARAFESEVPGGSGSKPGSMQRQVPAQKTELTATEKIRAGLNKGQAVQGRGTAGVA